MEHGSTLKKHIRLEKPQLVIIENVSSLRNKGLVVVLQDLWKIGYDAEWHIIPASRLGYVQRRERCIIIAYPIGDRVQRLLTPECFGKVRSRWPCCSENLQQIYNNPVRDTCWPQPLICRDHERISNWVDQIRLMGNCIIPDIPEIIGYAWIEHLLNKT